MDEWEQPLQSERRPKLRRCFVKTADACDRL
jgi:hypothetical protein